MMDQELINKVESILEDALTGGYHPEISYPTLNELLLNYKNVIADNASLHKQLSVLRADKIQKTYVCNN